MLLAAELMMRPLSQRRKREIAQELFDICQTRQCGQWPNPRLDHHDSYGRAPAWYLENKWMLHKWAQRSQQALAEFLGDRYAHYLKPKAVMLQFPTNKQS